MGRPTHAVTPLLPIRLTASSFMHLPYDLSAHVLQHATEPARWQGIGNKWGDPTVKDCLTVHLNQQ